jgi:hypothetical protein
MVYEYRVTGGHSRMTYSRHRTLDAALRSARDLAQKWGWSPPGAEPRVEQLTWNEPVPKLVLDRFPRRSRYGRGGRRKRARRNARTR